MDINKLLDNARGLCKAANDKELAHRLGVTPPAISNYRNGRALPDAVVCDKLAKITGQPLRQVIGIVGEARARSAAEKAVWRRLATAASLALAMLPAVYTAPANATSERVTSYALCAVRMRKILMQFAARVRAQWAASVMGVSDGTRTATLLGAW